MERKCTGSFTNAFFESSSTSSSKSEVSFARSAATMVPMSPLRISAHAADAIVFCRFRC